ncbi:hypothetical protein ACQW02_00960 [Humitalea sp. 24SJ18S-53]|uniref:hypothetical protein n=1 Tax=Humitalea sp. 24SJ18S-53 TaxID=3422307 RepID=UPI003D677161
MPVRLEVCCVAQAAGLVVTLTRNATLTCKLLTQFRCINSRIDPGKSRMIGARSFGSGFQSVAFKISRVFIDNDIKTVMFDAASMTILPMPRRVGASSLMVTDVVIPCQRPGAGAPVGTTAGLAVAGGIRV